MDGACRPAFESEMISQTHGADIYGPLGKPEGLLDFSNTVVEIPPPQTWHREFTRSAGSLRHYPQPYAQGLSIYIENELGLSAGSVQACNGSSEGLAWVAASLAGQRVLIEAPCFGEYAPWLKRHGAFVREVGAEEPARPDWDRLSKAARGAASLWVANPSNPSGRVHSRAEFRERLDWCRRHRVLLVWDEALAAQRLDGANDEALNAAVAAPGLLVLRSLSKGLGLPGLRLGYLAGHPLEMARLGHWVERWSVNSLAQSMGAWLFREERRLAKSRTRQLAACKADLLKRLAPLSAWLQVRPSDTGFFLVRIMGKHFRSSTLAARVRREHVLVRACASYGGWGSGYLRLNPRLPKDNAKLVTVLTKIFKKFS